MTRRSPIAREVHVEPHEAYRWRVRITGHSVPRKVADTRHECEAFGRRIARVNGWKFVLHTKSGGVEARDDYGFVSA